MEKEKLTKIQEEIMCIFWRSEEDLNINDIIKLNKNLSLSLNVIRKTITLLIKKGFLEEFRDGSDNYITYITTISYSEYILLGLEELINTSLYSSVDIVKALTSGETETYKFNIDDDELVEVYNLISSRLKEHFEEEYFKEEYFKEEDFKEEEYTKKELEADIDKFLSNLEISLNDLFLDDEFYAYVLELQTTVNELKINLVEINKYVDNLEKRFLENTKFISNVINYIDNNGEKQ